MSKLELSTTSLEINDLLKKYNDCLAPEVSIFIGSKDLILDEEADVKNIEVDLSMSQASMCVFNIVNGYDIKAQKFLWVDNLLKNGEEVTVKMGYKDKISEVFIGNIDSVSIRSSDTGGSVIEVTAFDKSSNMKRAKKSKTWVDKSYSDVVSEIAGNYNLKVSCGDTGGQEAFIVQKNQTDFDFIKQLALDISFSTFVLGKNLYFRDFSDGTMQKKLITFLGNDNLNKFECKKSSANQVSKAIISGYDYSNRKEVKAEVKSVKQLNNSKNSGIGDVKIIDDSNSAEEIYKTVMTKKDAQAIGQSFINQLGSKYFTGSGTCLGLPDIVPGRYIEVKNFGKEFDISFCVERVQHIFGLSGYTTIFSFGLDRENPSNQTREDSLEKMFGNYLAEVTGMAEDNQIIVKMPSRGFEEVIVNMMTMSTGVESGHVFFPSIGDQVLISYMEGDINQPFIMGCIWDKTNKPPLTVDEDNNIKMIRTPSGNELAFYDESGKEKIEIKSTSGQLISLDDASGKITLADSNNSNNIVIDSKAGSISLNADKKMSFTVGGVSIEIDGLSGSIKLNSTNSIDIKSTNITIDAKASAKVKGGASTSVESSGILNLKGSMTKIN